MDEYAKSRLDIWRPAGTLRRLEGLISANEIDRTTSGCLTWSLGHDEVRIGGRPEEYFSPQGVFKLSRCHSPRLNDFIGYF